MKKHIAILMLATMTSCSSGWHLRQAIKKDPSIMVPKRITVIDTFYTPEVIVRDSFFLKEVDTVSIEKDRFWTRIVRVRDSIFVDGGCLSDTVVLEKTVYVPQVVHKERDNPSIWWIFLILIIISIVVWEFLKGRRL